MIIFVSNLQKSMDNYAWHPTPLALKVVERLVHS